MMNNVLKLASVLFSFFLFVGCQSDDTEDQQDQTTAVEEVKQMAVIDDSDSVLNDLVFQSFTEEENLNKSSNRSFLPQCASILVELNANQKQVILDFGVDGCTINDRYVFKGKIVMNYTVEPDFTSVIIDYDLQNFSINDISFTGKRTATWVLKNQNGNPELTVMVDGAVIINDAEIKRKGLYVREWIEGVFNGNWGDNVYLITGNWETIFPNGNIHSSEVKVALRRELSCRYFVSGQIELIRSTYQGVLDYGDGTCDNAATFTTTQGAVVEITL
ncbi:hypothetical protein ACJRPK_15130 [Aquimarina sp. 2-A2]|uniref:hypothetical protein n=1 Tax=Aquimarina sp. 2-A2 TaxID=3382644 RepID=UPI00387F038D